MKLFLLLSFLIATAVAVTPACAPASYCRGCSETTATHCTTCHNWMSGTLGPRYLATNTCTTAMTAVTDCMVYADQTSAASTTTDNCMICKKGYYMVSGTNATNANKATTCVKTIPTGCVAIANCRTTKCSQAAGGAATYTATCQVCDAGKGAASTTACTATILANCDTAYWTAGSTVQGCWYPKSGYAVVNAGTSTVAYTTDKNCRQLGSVVTTQCVECWDGYYWNTTMCKLFSKVFVAGFMVFIGMFIN